MPCDDLIPFVSDGSIIPTFEDGNSCHQVYFTGITDKTIMRGDAIDLEDGIHAYDGNDNEIAFTYTPTSIDTSIAGEYVVTYTANGEGKAMKPNICGDMALHITDCGLETATVRRKITVISMDALVCEATVCESLIGC